MKCKIIMVCLLVLLWSVPCSLADTADDTSIEMLKWLDTTSAEQSFRKDRDAGRLRFYAVYGYATEIVGVGGLNFARCYGEVELTTIEGTSDNTMNKEHFRLNSLANAFAGEYNSLMKNHIDSIGKRNCTPQADWDAMVAAVTNKVWGPRQVEGSVSLNSTGPPVLGIYLKDINRTNEILDFTCKAVQDHGIDEVVLVEVCKWQPGAGFRHQKFKEFKWFKGNIAP